MIELLGGVGSPLDAAMFVYVVAQLRYGLADRLESLEAGTVALAETDPQVNAARLASDLEVEDRDVAAYRVAATDGGEKAT